MSFLSQGASKNGAIYTGPVVTYSGKGVPSATLGANGDFYYRQDGSAGACIYQKRAGAWVATNA